MGDRAILVVDDDPDVLSSVETALTSHHHPVLVAHSGGEALSLLREHNGSISVLLLDLAMASSDSMKTLREVREISPQVAVIAVSDDSEPERIVDAMKAGANDFLSKPIAGDKLLEKVSQVWTGSVAEVCDGSTDAAGSRYVYANRQMRAITESLHKVAAWDVPVVLRGESGSGKEVLARELHRVSPRATKAFVKINCVALPSELLESELFGYERGAFTGAFRAKPGKFEMADGGTILLDEIGDMDLNLQAKLLQVLQDGEFHRLGGKEPVKVDARVLVATHCDLEAAIEAGTFREDLYYRLNVVSVVVPPLRDRRDEILPLAQHFLHKHRRADMDMPEIPPDLEQAMVANEWPGNVRELENAMRRYLVFRDPTTLMVELAVGDSRPRSKAQLQGLAHGSPVTDLSDVNGVAEAESFVEASGLESPTNGGSPAEVGGQEANGAEPGGMASGEPFPASSQKDAGVPQPPPNGQDRGSHRAGGSDGSLIASPSASGRGGPGERAISSWGGWSSGPSSPEGTWNLRLAAVESMLRKLLLPAMDSRNVTPNPAPSRPRPDGTDRPAPGQHTAGGESAEENRLATLGEVDEAHCRAESEVILNALRRTEWNRKKAAALLKVDYKALLYRMKKLGIGEKAGSAGSGL